MAARWKIANNFFGGRRRLFVFFFLYFFQRAEGWCPATGTPVTSCKVTWAPLSSIDVLILLALFISQILKQYSYSHVKTTHNPLPIKSENRPYRSKLRVRGNSASKKKYANWIDLKSNKIFGENCGNHKYTYTLNTLNKIINSNILLPYDVIMRCFLEF